MKHSCILLAIALATVLQAAVPVAWTNTPATTQPYPLKPVPHGVPINFRVTLKGYTEPPVAPGADLHLWYQTNGMGSAWWRAPATLEGDVITATFGPAQDTGADRVSLFFGAPSNAFAAAILRLTHSPGFRPSALPLPTPTLDFAAVELRNISALTNGWSFGGVTPEIVTNIVMDVSPAPGDYANVSNRAVNARQKSDMTAWIPGIPTASGTGWFTVDGETAAWNGFNYVTPSGMIILYDAGVFWLVYDPKDGYMGDVALAPPDYTTRVVNNNSGHLYTVRGYLPATLATSLDVDVITNDLQDLRVESSLIYRLYSGSNAVMEVTNYNSRVNPSAMRLQQLNDEGEYVTIWTETNGLARIARAATNYTDSVSAADRAAAAAAYAPRAWSRVTSGLGVDAPENITWISTPTTVIAGGLEYEKVAMSSGQLWFLRSNGMQMATNSFGYLSISATDGTEIFSIEKTDSYLVGVDADGIQVSGNTVTLTLGVVSAEHPLLRYTPSLSPVAWEYEEIGFTSPITAVWSGSSGAWVCTVTTSATQGFFMFEFMQEGSVKIKNSASLDVSAGILCTDGKTKIRPVNTNGTITWEIVQ